MKKLSNNLRAIREKLSLSREELADLLQVQPSTISNYENEIRDFPVINAYKLLFVAGLLSQKYTLEDVYPREKIIPKNWSISSQWKQRITEKLRTTIPMKP